MSRLDLYTVFHGNLQFSSIRRSDYRKVIRNCYWPLLNILEKNKQLKLGIEFSGLTLYEIRKIDNSLIKKIKELIESGRLEFIGSSYSQAIFPLVPFEVNLKNLELGIKVYKEILDKTPKVFYVPEQTFSDGIIEVYEEAGIKNIIVDFDSAREPIRMSKSLLGKPVRVVSQKGRKINVIWSSSIAFQKFQRYIFDEISYKDYQDYLYHHFPVTGKKDICIYAGDWEVFGFSPKRINRSFKDDYKRMTQLFGSFSKDKGIGFVLPSQLTLENIAVTPINLTDFQDPVICKKQEKYNVSRWAIAGKNSIFRNTQCFKLLKKINLIKNSKSADKQIIEKLEKNLVKLWGSDFRTNTTSDKDREYESLLSKSSKFGKKYKSADNIDAKLLIKKNNKVRLSISPQESFETPHVKLVLDKRKGASIRELIFPKITSSKMAGLVPHGYFQNPRLSADWFTGHCLFEADDGNKYTDLYPTEIFLGQGNSDRFIDVCTEIKTPLCDIEKSYRIYNDSPRLDLEYLFEFKSVGLRSARIGNVTLDPHCFDEENFWYGTVNGGRTVEIYKMGKPPIVQDEMVSFRISSKGTLGATEGWVAVGDKNKGLAICWDKAQIATCPIVHFENTSQGIYGRIQPSIAESDETGFPVFNGLYRLTISYIGLSEIRQIYNFKKLI